MIAIIDYGVGNLRSVQKAFELMGHEAVVTGDPERVRAADKVVLPGVGAFTSAMAALRSGGMIPVLREAVSREKPLLGICLGMQLLFERSQEGGSTEGLSVLPGRVTPIRGVRKVPHMGWNSLTLRPSPLFAGLTGKPWVYFVHSYRAEPTDPAIVLATTRYGEALCAAAGSGRVFATQFHPEKSGPAGLKILNNFGAMR
ncbi:MAG: imidazole glycerol phosphate synthase subunit HisH [Christensenellales bacterium]|jgi:glutamine amidotransferase